MRNSDDYIAERAHYSFASGESEIQEKNAILLPYLKPTQVLG